MDWIARLKDIKSKLIEAGYIKTADEITKAQMVLGTPGEMYLSVMNVLLKLKKSNNTEYIVVKDDIEDLIQYGESINYL